MAINMTTAGLSRSTSKAGSGLLHSMRMAFEDWQERARVRDELMQMSSRELADLGLNPSDIEEVAAGTYRREG